MLPRHLVCVVRVAWVAGVLGLEFCGTCQASQPQSPKEAPSIYKPVATDFGPEYLKDKTNSAKQSWNEYWGWVTSYYEGTLLASGWIKETETSLARVTDPARRGDLLREMNEAGRLVSREWAKDSGVRKINTNDLIAWGNRLNTVRRNEKATDADLLATARQIHGEAKRKIAGQPAPK